LVDIKINIKIVILSLLIAVFMYPKTLSLVASTAKNLYIAHTLNINEGLKTDSSNWQESSLTLDSNKTKVVVMFDGGWSSVFTEAYEIMKEFDFKGSVSVIPSQVDEEGFLSYGELAELYLDNWDLLNHSYSHAEKLINKSDELLSDFNRGREWMRNRSIGRNSDNVVVPYGEINPYLLKLLENNGYHSVRTSGNVIRLDKNKYYYYPVNVLNLSSGVTAKDVRNFLEQSLKDSRDVILIFNKVANTDDDSGMTYSINHFEEIIKLLVEMKDEFQVVTYSQL